jgi:hypothetical protein
VLELEALERLRAGLDRDALVVFRFVAIADVVPAMGEPGTPAKRYGGPFRPLSPEASNC